MPTASANIVAAFPPAETQVVEKNVKENPAGQRLLKMRVMRREDGVIIEMQSDLDFFSAFKVKPGQERIGDFRCGGVVCHECRNPIRLHTGRNMMMNWADSMQKDGYINFSMLMAKGLREGVTFKFTGLPMSADGLKEWAVNMKDAVKEIYQDYLKPVEFTVNLSSTVKDHEDN